MQKKKGGYPSEVAFAFFKDDYVKMLKDAAIAAAGDKTFNRAFLSRQPRLSEGFARTGEPVVVMYWGEVNWYAFHPEVQFLTQWADKNARAYKFLRIGYYGETDVEEADTFGQFDSFFRVQKSICIELDRSLRARNIRLEPRRPKWAQYE